MLRQEGTKLSLTRGDSGYFYTCLTTPSAEIVPFIEGEDIIYFTVKRNVHTTEVVLQKRITEFTGEGKAYVYIHPDDTANLDYGQYVYDIQHTRNEDSENPHKHTYIKEAIFNITGEVTYD